MRAPASRRRSPAQAPARSLELGQHGCFQAEGRFTRPRPNPGGTGRSVQGGARGGTMGSSTLEGTRGNHGFPRAEGRRSRRIGTAAHLAGESPRAPVSSRVGAAVTCPPPVLLVIGAATADAIPRSRYPAAPGQHRSDEGSEPAADSLQIDEFLQDLLSHGRKRPSAETLGRGTRPVQSQSLERGTTLSPPSLGRRRYETQDVAKGLLSPSRRRAGKEPNTSGRRG